MLLAGDNDRALELFTISAERGFFGSNEAFAYELVKRGNRLAAALGIWQWEKGDLSYPAEAFLDALEFPERDHSDGLARFLAWAESRNIEPSQRATELVALGGFKYATPADFNNSWIWEERQSAFRESEYFKPLVKKLGLARYWKEKRFPPICQPMVEEDFKCDPDAYRAERGQ